MTLRPMIANNSVKDRTTHTLCGAHAAMCSTNATDHKALLIRYQTFTQLICVTCVR